jgi:hypothetical protein
MATPVPIFATWRPNNENEANVAIEALEAGTLKVTDVLLGDESLAAASSRISTRRLAVGF